MSQIGEKTEIANASEGHLILGGLIYVMLKDFVLHVGRPEDRMPTTDEGALYTYGKGDNWMTFTLVSTTPELKTIVDYNILGANGGINNDGGTLAWTMEIIDLAGGKATFTTTGNMRKVEIIKNREGKWDIECDVRITTDSVAVGIT